MCCCLLSHLLLWLVLPFKTTSTVGIIHAISMWHLVLEAATGQLQTRILQVQRARVQTSDPQHGLKRIQPLSEQPIQCWWRVPPDRTNTTTVRKCAKQTTLDQTQRLRSIEQNSLSLFNLPHQHTADRVFIGGGSPTNPRNYTVMPPNNYILGIFQGQGRIFTSRSGLQLDFYCSPGPASYIIIRQLGLRYPRGAPLLLQFSGLRLNSLVSSLGFARCLRPRGFVSSHGFARRLRPRGFVSPHGFAWRLRKAPSPALRKASLDCSNSGPRMAPSARGPSVDGQRWSPQHLVLVGTTNRY